MFNAYIIFSVIIIKLFPFMLFCSVRSKHIYSQFATNLPVVAPVPAAAAAAVAFNVVVASAVADASAFASAFTAAVVVDVEFADSVGLLQSGTHHIAYFLVHSRASSLYFSRSVLYILAISGTRGSSGLGSQSREQIDNKTARKRDKY